MNEIVTIAAVIVLALALGAQTGRLVTRNYYKGRERERTHSREKRLLEQVIKELGRGARDKNQDR
jgi:hypothetical protein